MTISPDEIRRVVADVLKRITAQNLLPTALSESLAEAIPAVSPPKIITEKDVLSVNSNQIIIGTNTIITPLARDTAHSRGIKFVLTTEKKTTPVTLAANVKTVAIGSDHGGFALKEKLKLYLREAGYQIKDLGCHSTESVDYPDFAQQVAESVASGSCWRGIMIDGAGIGSGMVANKIMGVRAAVCHDAYSAQNSREHNDANVLTLGAMIVGEGLAKQVVKIFLETPFAGGRHARRVAKINALDA